MWQRRLNFVPVSLWQYLITLSISFRTVQLHILVSDHQGSWGDVGQKFFFVERHHHDDHFIPFLNFLTLYPGSGSLRILGATWDENSSLLKFLWCTGTRSAWSDWHQNPRWETRVTFFCCNFYSKFLRLLLWFVFWLFIDHLFFCFKQSLLPLVFCG